MQISEIIPGIILASKQLAHVRSVSLGFWIRSGVAYEKAELLGASHFLEHMLFKGTDRRSARDISESFDNIGGEINAYTAKEYTCFYCKVVDQHLETAVDVLSDMICHPRLDGADVDKERNVVLEEIRMYEDSPDEYVHDLLAVAVLPDHPLGRPILGTRNSLASIDAGALRSFYQQHYRAGNIIIAAAGSLEHERLATWLADRLYLPAAGPQLAPVENSCFSAPRCLLVEKPTEQLHLTLGFSGLALGDEQVYAWNLLNNIMGSGMSSRLFQRLREEHALVYNAYTYTASFQQTGYTAFYLGLAPHNLPLALDLIAQELVDVCRQGVTEDELRRAKEQVKGALIMGMESTANHMGRLGRGLLLLSRVQEVEDVIRKVEAVTIADIANLANVIYKRDKMATAAVGQVETVPQVLENFTW
ncbi:MAG: insulinase family protein [Firmicutes bacterium]|nr:insulinase family protein [Bacillota bacterium]